MEFMSQFINSAGQTLTLDGLSRMDFQISLLWDASIKKEKLVEKQNMSAIHQFNTQPSSIKVLCFK